MYTHNSSVQPFSQHYDLVSHIIYIVCINFIHEWWDLQLKVDYVRQIFEKLFHVNFIYFRIFLRNLLRESPEKICFLISFCCRNRDLSRGLTSSKSTHYILNYGDLDTNYYYILLLLYLLLYYYYYYYYIIMVTIMTVMTQTG